MNQTDPLCALPRFLPGAHSFFFLFSGKEYRESNIRRFESNLLPREIELFLARTITQFALSRETLSLVLEVSKVIHSDGAFAGKSKDISICMIYAYCLLYTKKKFARYK